MKSCAIQDANARISDLRAPCLRDGPERVTTCGIGAAMLVPADESQRVSQAAKSSLKALLLSDARSADIPVPPRGARRRRPDGLAG